jgi:hexosaminidase
MILKSFFARLLLILILTASISCKQSEKSVSLIPLPQSISYSGKVYYLKDKLIIGYKNPEVESLLPLFIGYLGENDIKSTALKVDFADISANTDIYLILDSTINLTPEAYELEIDELKCVIKASTAAGLLYGMQTMRQMIYQSNSIKRKIPTLKIFDSPRFEWRGMHLDVSRHFFPKEFIMEYIDYMAFLKMNVFHWHLVDDQGWRIEIKKYPKLTSIGAWRDSTWIGHNDDGTGKYDGIRYGGYYSQDEIREIIAYASERFITIVPEIEIPGHSQAAIASYPKLGCTDDTVSVWTKWGISPYIYNIDDSTFSFLFNVLDEVITLFPSQYIHIGGDEALKDQWKASIKIQQQMRKLGIKDEIALQGYFTKRIEEYVSGKGRNIIGWDEILECEIPKSAAVMSWRGVETGIAAANKNHKVVMSPTEFCYFDYYQSNDISEPLAIGGYIPVEKVYSFNPVPEEFTHEEAGYIIGTQANVWTEYLKSPESVEYMIFPRIFAMSEVQWTNQEKRSYEDFIVRLQHFENYLKKNNINYAKHLF